MAITSKNKRKLYPTVLCYHGFVSSRQAVLTFREHYNDLMAHVEKMKRAGYKFLLPSEYYQWYLGNVKYDQPVALIQHDDCLDSLDIIVPWLIENNIPCGIAIIGRRLAKYDPEEGYTRWEVVRDWVKTGLVEINSHTYNLHTLAIYPDGEEGEGPGGIYWGYDGNLSPVLEGLCWIDDGDVVYRAAGDSRWYWDFSFVDRVTLGLPLFGTDPYDGVSPITTNIQMRTKQTGTVNVLRLWLSLSFPSGSGYSCRIQIRANGSLVFDGNIEPHDYETRTQWPEREFYTINLDTPFNITAGGSLTLNFKTMNTSPDGVGMAGVLYGIPTSDVAGYVSTTSCQGLYPAGSQGWPDMYYQYIDYPPGDRWPVVPVVILGFGTGRIATEAEYTNYITQDCSSENTAVQTWMSAEWNIPKVWDAPWVAVRDHDWAPWYPANQRVHYVQEKAIVGWASPNLVSASLAMSSGSTITVDFLKFVLQPTEFFQGGDADPYIYTWGSDAVNRSYAAVFNLYISYDNASWRYVGQAPIWTMTKDLSCDVEPFTINAGQACYLLVSPVNPGPTITENRVCRWPIVEVYAGVKSTGQVFPAPKQIVYPFGAYRSQDNYYATTPYGEKDLHPNLKTIFESSGYQCGYTIQAYRNVNPELQFREPDLRNSKWVLGRFLLYGDQSLAGSNNNVEAYSGFYFNDVSHRGVDWQVSLEADEAGCATLKERPQVLDYVAFDAWYFDGEGNILPHQTNDGGTYWNEDEQKFETFPDDKGWLQERGIKCLLILNNNLGTGEPSPVIGAHVVNNPDIYIPKMIQICQEKGWDGITCNIEEMGSDQKEASNNFYYQAARAFHDQGLLLHATVPAITGTDYDAEWWMGWCDLGFMASVCDAIKIMSYTETGPHSEPGPAAPDWFWQATYEYTRRVVPEIFWPRVLCGCRSFGHFWYTGAEDTADYVSYHQAIAEALVYAAQINIESTEGNWTYKDKSCWFGTPLTVDRSQKEAVQWGFGGLGLWKLDDGDIEEFFPLYKQIGRAEDMSFLDVRFPETVSWGTGGGPSFETYITQTKSGDEFRASMRSMPLYTYDVSLKIQTTEQFEAVRNLFMVARGKANSFRFKDWADYILQNVLIGVGDGSTTNFQCTKAYTAGTQSLVRKITKLVSGTTKVYLNGVQQTSGFTVNNNTGIISFATAPGSAVEVRVYSEFDVQVRFDIDVFTADIEIWGEKGPYFEAGSVTLVEVRS